MRALLALLLLTAVAPACSKRAPGCVLDIPRGDGSGDVGGYFPMASGDRWLYEVTAGAGAAALGQVEVTGTDAATGSQIFVESLLGDAAATPSALLLAKAAGAIVQEAGASDDPLTRAVLPNAFLPLPLRAGAAYVQADCAAIGAGRDFDGDGKEDSLDLRSTVTVGAADQLDLPIGAVSALPVKTEIAVTVHGTRGQSGSATTVETDWYAQGIGLLQSQIAAAGQPPAQMRRLVGYAVDGMAHGLSRFATLASGVAPADSNTLMPGRPALSFDGAAHLLVSAQATSNFVQAPADGYVVSAGGGAGAPFALARTFGAAQFGGGVHLVAFAGCATSCGMIGEIGDAIIGQRISTAGTVLDTGFLVAQASGMDELARPSIASGASEFLLAYAQRHADQGYAAEIRAARVDTSGAVLGDVQLRAPAAGIDLAPAAAFDGENFLVAWLENGQILARRVSPDGTVLDAGVIAVSGGTAATAPALSCGGSACLAVWSDSRSGATSGAGPAVDVYGARIAAGAVLDAAGLRIDATSGASKGGATVAFDGSDWIAAWWIDGYQAPAGVYAARISTSGAVDPARRLSYVTVFGARAVSPQISPDGPGRALVAWSYNTEVSGQTKSIQAAWVAW